MTRAGPPCSMVSGAPFHQCIDRGVGGVAVVSFKENVRDRILGQHQLGQRKKRHPLPRHVQLAPGGDTVEVAGVIKLIQRHELFPVECHGVDHLPVDF